MTTRYEEVVVVDPVSAVIKKTVLAAFTFLTALSFRDVFQRTLESVLPDNSKEKLIFAYLNASIILLLTVILAFIWSSSIDKH